MNVTSSRYTFVSTYITGCAVLAPAAYFLLTAVLFLPGCDRSRVPPPAPAGGALNVAATIPPVADWVRQVGGPHVDVFCLLKPGSSPHLYEPSPADSLRVAQCRLVFCIGLGLDQWIDDLVRAGGSSAPQIVKLGEELPKNVLISGDPHVWLDPDLAAKMVASLAAKLSDADPAHGPEYRRRCSQYLAELADLSARCDELSRLLRGRKAVTFHRAFAYLLRRCGVELLGVVQPQPGESSTTGHLAELAAQMRRSGVSVIFTEPQFSDKPARALAAEIGAGLVPLDPLGDPTDADRGSYIKLMLFNLRQIRDNLLHKTGDARPRK
ncbi:MAG: zinc ABC transporter substrate-binding protein [Armatimonadetes bacterium]|nr:zinc ABC transporter substrate-binding protein [Armatimonadota bacterium]